MFVTQNRLGGRAVVEFCSFRAVIAVNRSLR